MIIINIFILQLYYKIIYIQIKIDALKMGLFVIIYK